jgi:uncharacterized metal-binding protein YceD (DUF177 family)
MEKEDPILTIPKTDIVLPILVKERILMELPIAIYSKQEQADPSLFTPYTEIDEPPLEKERKLIELPIDT